MPDSAVKMKLVDSMVCLVNKKPMSKISVQDISDGAGVTRQTFYRNFDDKFALINWYFEMLVRDCFVEISKHYSLESALEKKFNFIQDEIKFFNEAFKSQDYDSLVEYDYRYILAFYTSIITKKLGEPLSEDIAFSLEMYCRGSIYKTVEWVKDDHRVCPRSMATRLVNALPENLKNLLINFE